MQDNEDKIDEPLIGINMLYTSFPHIREKYGTMKDFYMIQHLYVEGIVNAGGIPVLIPSVEKKDLLAKYAEKVDAFLFIGGPDYPSRFYNEVPHEKNASHARERQDSDILLIREVLQREIPILGICAGAQILNIALGGKLIQDIPNAEKHVKEQYHNAEICDNTLLKKLLQADICQLNSSHHQAVDPEHLGCGCRVSAYAEDGTIEAFEGMGSPFMLGVQFHIERHRNVEYRKRVFFAFIESAKEYALNSKRNAKKGGG